MKNLQNEMVINDTHEQPIGGFTCLKNSYCKCWRTQLMGWQTSKKAWPARFSAAYLGAPFDSVPHYAEHPLPQVR